MAYKIRSVGLSNISRDLSNLRQEARETIRKLDSTTLELNLGIKIIIKDVDTSDLKALEQRVIKEIKKAHSAAVRSVRNNLEKALDQAMENPLWAWISGSRDIIDTGQLRDSRRVIIDSDNDIHIIYNEEYAAIVHYGGYVNAFGDPERTYYYPGRPWVTALLEGNGPIEKFPFESLYQEAFIDYLRKIKL